MIILTGYTITKLLSEQDNSLIYRAYRESDKQPVVIKVLKDEKPTLNAIAQLHHEYRLLEILNGMGANKAYALEKHENRFAIILEDFGTFSLKDMISRKKFPLREFLLYAIKIVEALGKVHSHHIIHFNLNPENILCDISNFEVKISNFNLAPTLSNFSINVNNIYLLDANDLPYISPEKTGKSNRKIDYRTDYYSLGLIFYEMLLGTLPFQGKDISELIYNRLVNLPQPLNKSDPSVPVVVSNIIMKLLEKNPEDRYQSIEGITNDLNKCLEYSNLNADIKTFPIATQDIAKDFVIPEKNYGCEDILQKIFTSFDKARNGSVEFILLAASESGIDKATLVRELYIPLVKNNGYFIAAKFEQFNRNIPYASISSAFDNFIRQILNESETQIRAWRSRIQHALGSNGQIIADVIPNIHSLIGEQPPVPQLGPTETKNRFNIVFQNFMRAISSAEHPMLIYLDDLQWADVPSLKILENYVLNKQSSHTLIIAAYNADEINETCVMMPTIDMLKKSGAWINTIKLHPLTLKHTTNLLVDALHQDEITVQPLANVCYEKTKGNPFSLELFLKRLYSEKIIYFNDETNRWAWKTVDVQLKKIPGYFIDLVTDEINNLSNSSRYFLQYAACFGQEFDLHSIAVVSEYPLNKIAGSMLEAMHAELIVPTNNYNLYDYIADDEKFTLEYKFTNDYVLNAARSLIDKNTTNNIHLKIGRYILKITPEEKIAKYVLEMVQHLNFGLIL